MIAEHEPPAAHGTIEIVPYAAPLQSLLMFARWRRLSIELDGVLGRLRWGAHRFVVAPGDHVVTVGLGMSTFANKATITVHVAATETVRLRYTPHLINQARGTLEIERLPTAYVIHR